MAYRISYVDCLRVPRLIEIADTLEDAQKVRDRVVASVAESAGRMSLAEDPLSGLASRVVRPPESLDSPGGLPVIYLGGTVTTDRNWQAEAIAALAGEAVVIANPRREQPPVGTDDRLTQVAWQNRHFDRSDVALYWLESREVDPVMLVAFGLAVTSSVPLAIGMAPDFPRRDELCAVLADVLPGTAVAASLPEAINAAVELLGQDGPRRVRLPYHDDAGPSAWALKLGIVHLQMGQPSSIMRLNELMIEVGCAAGKGIDPCFLARICVGADRLRQDPDDPLAWAELTDVVHALDVY